MVQLKFINAASFFKLIFLISISCFISYFQNYYIILKLDFLSIINYRYILLATKNWHKLMNPKLIIFLHSIFLTGYSCGTDLKKIGTYNNLSYLEFSLSF